MTAKKMIIEIVSLVLTLFLCIYSAAYADTAALDNRLIQGEGQLVHTSIKADGYTIEAGVGIDHHQPPELMDTTPIEWYTLLMFFSFIGMTVCYRNIRKKPKQ